MKKTLYTLFMLLLCGVQTLMAADEVTVKYQLTTRGDFPTENSAVGGTFFADDANTYKSSVNCSDDTDSVPKRWTMKKSGAYIKVQCNETFAEGDLISIVATTRSTSTNGVSLRLTSDYTDDVVAVIKANGKQTKQTLKYEIDAGSKLIGKDYFYVFLTDASRQHWYESITVTSASTASGINSVEAVSVEAENTSSEVYSLSGQKVDGSYKGIVIKNGKKYLQK